MATGDSTHPGPGDESVNFAQLNHTNTGRWEVTTHTAIHLIDRDQRTLLRVPGAGLEHGRNRLRHQAYVTRDLPSTISPISSGGCWSARSGTAWGSSSRWNAP